MRSAHSIESSLECVSVQALLPTLLDARESAPARMIEHVEHCLACRAELARYRRLLRLLRTLDEERCSLPDGALADLIGGLSDAAGRSAVRSLLSNRRAAYLGAVSLVAIAAPLVALAAHRHQSARRSEGARPLV